MDFERVTSPLEDGRDIVIYPRGSTWGFRLPRQHTITLHRNDGWVYLATPDHGGGFRLDRIDEVGGEFRVFLGVETGDQHATGTGALPPLRAYALPPIQVELERLTVELVDLGGLAQEAQAWEQGASYDSQTAALRARIRELRGQPLPAVSAAVTQNEGEVAYSSTADRARLFLGGLADEYLMSLDEGYPKIVKLTKGFAIEVAPGRYVAKQ